MRQHRNPDEAISSPKKEIAHLHCTKRTCRCCQSDLRQATMCGKIFAAADVAQLAEHITRNNEVMGSIPIIGSKAPQLRGVSFYLFFVRPYG